MKIRRQWKKLNRSGKIASILLAILVVTALLSALFIQEAHRIPSGRSLEAPGAGHLLGTDDLGLDILAQLCRGALVSIMVGFGAALLAGLGGSVLGILAGYRGGRTDAVVMALCDIVLCMPRLPFMIVLGAFFGTSVRNIIIVIAILSWADPAKTVRAKVLSMQQDYYIIAARSYGAGFKHLLLRHFIPLLLPLIMVNMMRIISHAIIAEAGLSFLGLGDPSSKSWGVIINRAMNFPGIYFTPFWKWWLLPPLFALIILVFAIAVAGRSLEQLQNDK